MSTTVSSTEFNRFPSKQGRKAYFSDQPVCVERRHEPADYVTIVPTTLWREAEEALREKREREGVRTAA